MAKITPKIEVRLKAYKIIADAVETGIDRGLSRAKKHTDRPTDDMIRESMYTNVMEELDGVINFGGEE